MLSLFNRKALEPQPDGPVPFGYKIGWFAVKSTDTQDITSSVGLRSIRPAAWSEGIQVAYDGVTQANGLVFVTPPIQGWTCVVGRPAAAFPLDEVLAEVVKLSIAHGEVQAFATHRVVEYHQWALVRKGQIERCFAWVGDQGELLRDEGALTEVEKSLGIFPFDPMNEDGKFPIETDVMTVAAAWSFDPTQLAAESAPPALGLLGAL